LKASTVQPSPASPASLAGLVALGILVALWSLLLWSQLVASRATGAAGFCPLGDAGECTALWNAPFASAVHRMTGIPVAGWGLVWGIVAAALPLATLVRFAEKRPAPALLSAVRITAGAGVAAVLLFFAVALSAQTLCGGCFVVYVLAAGYAGIALFGWPGVGMPDRKRGAAVAAGTTGLAAALLMYPGLKTPQSAAAVAQEALAQAPSPALPGTGDPERDQVLAQLVGSLPPALQQTLSDSLHITATSAAQPVPQARHVIGDPNAPVRITEWTDILCDHCAGLHDVLGQITERVPAGTFSIDSRQFPLDSACNPLLQSPPSKGESVRCLAAKARICVGGENEWKLAGALFAEQKTLSVEKIHTLAKPYMSRERLQACVKSEATRQRLEEDILAARPFDPDGTPIVAVNGRRGTSFGPYLYAIILTGGEPRHPAFASLPAANPHAHIH
jgi:serine/threonine-protein kinase